MDEEKEKLDEPYDIEFGGADVPVENDPDSLDLRRASDHEHFWVPVEDPMDRHPNRLICMVCHQLVDQNVQTQPWAPPPRFPRAGI